MAYKTSGGLSPLAFALVLASLSFGEVSIAQTSPPAPAANAGASGAASYPTCAKPPTKGEAESAHYAYLAGRHSFDEGDYNTAITYFKDAYRRDCTKHELLPIIARAHELNQSRAEAILALEIFLKRVPANDPQVETAKKRVANLKAQGENKPASAGAATGVASTSTSAPSPPPTPAIGEPASPPASSAPPAPAAAAPAPTGSSATDGKAPILPWIVVGAGAVAAGVGAVLLVGGLDKRSEATSRCSETGPDGRKCPVGVDSAAVQRDFDDGTSQATLGAVVLGVGGVAMIGGVVWYAVSKSSSSTAAGLSPWLGLGLAGASWSRQF